MPRHTVPPELTRDESQQLCTRLLEVLPEYTPRYKELLHEWRGDDPGAYNVFDELLRIPLRRALENNDAPNEVARIFELIEEILSTGSEAAQTMVAVVLLENLIGDSKRLINAEPFMGIATRQELRRMASS